MKTVIVPGTYDPLTLGHVDIIERALSIFDQVIVAVARHTPKQPLFSLEDRQAMLSEAFPNQKRVQIEAFEGLLVEFARERRVKFVLRGLRTVSDFEYENQMAAANRVMEPELETLLMVTDRRFNHLSSSLIREIASLGGDVKGMVPATVEQRLRKKFPQRA